MKTKICLLIFAFVASTALVFSQKKNGGHDEPGIARVRSISFFSPAYLSVNEGESVEVYFSADLGTVNIELKNNMGMIVSTEYVDTSIDSSVAIDISHLPADDYILEIKDEDGNVIKRFTFTI